MSKAVCEQWHTVTGEEAHALVRAEIVYCKLPMKGGEIFSVGSICFCGSLNHNNGMNGISKMIENVIMRSVMKLENFEDLLNPFFTNHTFVRA